MITLLILLGLIAVFHYSSKLLKKIGTFLEKMGESLNNKSIMQNHKYEVDSTKKEQLQKILRNIEEDNFKEEIRKEIESITKG